MEWASIPLALLGSLHVFILGWEKLVYGQASSRYSCETLQDSGVYAFWVFFIWCWSREGCSGIGQCFLHFSLLHPLTNPQPHCLHRLSPFTVPRPLLCRLSEPSAPAERSCPRPLASSVWLCAAAGAALLHPPGLALCSCLCPCQVGAGSCACWPLSVSDSSVLVASPSQSFP